ncbi:tail fiber protein [Fluviicola taffensis]|uniref:phage tail protein n=1 Tax=Fluviicola taffensis TaxID=191579 RepID=UPI003137E3D0
MEGTIGEIRMFAATFSPKTWSYCDGSIIAIASNTALFSILGTTYGGNGTTNFALPDLRGRIALGAGNAVTGTVYALGQRSGTNTTTLTVGNLPPHAHTGVANVVIPALSEGGTLSDPSGNHLSALTGMFAPASAGADTHLAPFNATVTDGVSGGGLSIPLMQAFTGMNYIICMYGIFPYRN